MTARIADSLVLIGIATTAAAGFGCAWQLGLAVLGLWSAAVGIALARIERRPP